jgi:hypothetical protein
MRAPRAAAERRETKFWLYAACAVCVENHRRPGVVVLDGLGEDAQMVLASHPPSSSRAAMAAGDSGQWSALSQLEQADPPACAP